MKKLPDAVQVLLAECILFLLDELDIANSAGSGFSAGQDIFDGLSYSQKIYLLSAAGRAMLGRRSAPPEPFFGAAVTVILKAAFGKEELVSRAYLSVFKRRSNDFCTILDRLEEYLLCWCRRGKTAEFAKLPEIPPEKTEQLSEKITTICEKILYQCEVKAF